MRDESWSSGSTERPAKPSFRGLPRSDQPRRKAPASHRVVLLGNPNSGKTTLFNRLTGSRSRVGNYPGITVECRTGTLRHRAAPGVAKPAAAPRQAIELVDMPGTYSLNPQSPEEALAVGAMMPFSEQPPDAVIVVADATALGRGLYLVLQLLELNLPVVVALTMMDEASAQQAKVNPGRLQDALGVPVVPLAHADPAGIERLVGTVNDALQRRAGNDHRWSSAQVFPEGMLSSIEGAVAASDAGLSKQAARSLATAAFMWVRRDQPVTMVPGPIRDAVLHVRSRLADDGWEQESAVVEARYRAVDTIREALTEPSQTSAGLSSVTPDDGGASASSVRVRRPWSDSLDSVLLHPVWGTLALLAVMGALFHLLFWGAEPLMGAIEAVVGWSQGQVSSLLPAGMLRDLLVDGVIAGVGNVIVFAPQIAFLFFIVAALEDSGYLARAAFLIDRLMGGAGLTGRAFVPMLSGFACAVPAVLATRTLERRRDRLLTMLVIPLTSCSARLPVYVLVTAVVFPADATLFGIFSLGAAVLLGLYSLSIVVTMLAALVLRRTVLPGEPSMLVLELPPYRRPALINLLRTTWERLRVFLVDAGTIILAMTVVLWALLAFPKSDAVTAKYEALREEVTTASLAEAPREARLNVLNVLDKQEAGEQLAYSAAGRFGKAVEPMLKLFGQDWRVGIAIFAAFSAREVFVGTLGIVWGIGETDEGSASLRDQLQAARWPDGRPLFTPLSGVALLVFFLLACQCMSTVAAVRRESGSWGWAAFLVGYMSVLAVGAAVGVYQLGHLLGWG